MRIGELAKAAGVNIQTIRFYEREGLLRAPDRLGSGYRCYAEGDLRRVRTIRALQASGFTLEDIRDLSIQEQVLAGRTNIAAEARSQAVTRILSCAEARLSTLKGRIGALESMRSRLEDLVLRVRHDTNLSASSDGLVAMLALDPDGARGFGSDGERLLETRDIHASKLSCGDTP